MATGCNYTYISYHMVVPPPPPPTLPAYLHASIHTTPSGIPSWTLLQFQVESAGLCLNYGQHSFGILSNSGLIEPFRNSGLFQQNYYFHHISWRFKSFQHTIHSVF